MSVQPRGEILRHNYFNQLYSTVQGEGREGMEMPIIS